MALHKVTELLTRFDSRNLADLWNLIPISYHPFISGGYLRHLETMLQIVELMIRCLAYELPPVY